MYAIVEIAGKQYKVREKDKLVVPRLNADVEDSVTFDRVLLVANGDDVMLGTPTLDNASVTATVVEHFKGDKVLVFRKKRRKRFKVKRGHRQPYTRIEVSDLSVDGKAKPSEKKSTSTKAKKSGAAKAASTKAKKSGAAKAEAGALESDTSGADAAAAAKTGKGAAAKASTKKKSSPKKEAKADTKKGAAKAKGKSGSKSKSKSGSTSKASGKSTSKTAAAEGSESDKKSASKSKAKKKGGAEKSE